LSPFSRAPNFQSRLEDLFVAGAGGFVGVTHFPHDGPLPIVYAGFAIIFLRVCRAVAARLEEAIENWHRSPPGPQP
jgi:hypothetical protein